MNEEFTFHDLAALRDWLNEFNKTDLSAVYFETARDGVADSMSITLIDETLSDGSTVTNARVTLR